MRNNLKLRRELIIALLFATASIVGCKEGKIAPHASGRFEAKELVVSSEATGKIVELTIKEGQQLEREEVVGVIDTLQLHLQKLGIIANLEALKERLVDIEKELSPLREQIKYLKQERARAEALLKADAGSQKMIDDIEGTLNGALSEYEANKNRAERGNSSIEKEITAVELQIMQIEDMIEKSLIRSPIKGSVMVTYAERGEFRATGQPLFRVANLERVYLRAYVENSLVNELKIGDEATIYSGFNGENSREYRGTITWISQEAEFTPKNIQSREERSNLVYSLKIEVENDGYIKLGMYGDVKFNIE